MPLDRINSRDRPAFEVRLLGRFAISRDGHEIPSSAYRSRLVRALVRLLVTRRGTFVSKDVLADGLWSERPPADPAANLEVLVSRARKAFGDASLILTGPGGYSFARDGRAEVDAEVLLADVAAGWEALREGRPDAALERFRRASDRWGEPLPEDAYSDWAREYRMALARARIEMLEGIAASALASGRRDLAVPAAEHTVALEPLREASNLLLVRALAASGDPAAALSAFDAFRARLAEELGVDPSPAAQEVHLRLLRGDLLEPPGPAPTPTHVGPLDQPTVTTAFVGREVELQRLLRAFGARGQAVALVVGPSGSGKSRLVQEVMARSALPVIAARAYPPDQGEAWGLARMLLTEALTLDVEASRQVPELAAQALTELVPDLGELRRIAPHRLDPRTSRALAIEGAVRLLAAAAPDGTLIVVDDLHWADASSLALLGLAIRRVPALQLLAAYRPEEFGEEGHVATFLARLADLATPVHVRLGPFEPETIHRLVRDVEIADAIIDGTERLPITVIGVLDELAEQGAIDTGGEGPLRRRSKDAVAITRRVVAEGQERGIRARVAGLPRPRQRVLNLLALLGREVPAGLLTHAASMDDPEVLEALDRLARGLLVRLGEGGWAVVHDRVADALVRDLSPEERAPMHARLAGALGQADADPAEVARHLQAAGEREAAAEAFARAARGALDRFANQEAEDAAGSGLALRPTGPTRLALLEVRAETRARNGDLAGARSDLSDALTTEPPEAGRARLHAQIAMLASGAEDLEVARELAELALVEAGDDRGARAQALAVAAVIDLNRNHLERSEQRFEEALSLFRSVGDTRGMAAIVDGRAMATFIGGRVREAVEAFDRAARLFTASGQLLEAITPRATGAYALVMMDQADEGLADADAALKLSRTLGHVEGECYALTQRTTALAALDRAREGIEDAARALALAERLDHQEWTALSLYCLGLAREAAADPDGAEEAYRRGMSVAERFPIHRSFSANRLARILIARGRLEEAERLLERSLAEGPPLTSHEARVARAELLAARGEPGLLPATREAIRLAERGGYLVAVPRLRELASV